MSTHYDVLGISADADENEIKKAYRALSFKHHPDRCSDAASIDIMKNLNEAYEILRDSQKRQQYDAGLRGGFPPGFPPGFGGGFPPGFGGGNIFEMLFSQMSGQGGGVNIEIVQDRNGATFIRRHIGKPETIIKSVAITLEQAYSGTIAAVDIERWIMRKEDGLRVSEMETINVKIPAGIDVNDSIVLEGIGNCGESKGDIKICITIDKHKSFVRQGADLFFKKALTLKEALCGTQFQFDHINGKNLTLNVFNAIVFPGGKKVFPNMGMIKADGTIGNLVIDFDVQFPPSLTQEQKEQLSAIL